MSAKKIFLSYARRDLNYNVVSRLQWALKELPGVEVWIDAERIQPGARVWRKIGQALETSDIFVPIISEAYNASKGALFEIEAALEQQGATRRLLIIPVRIDRSLAPRILHGQPVIDLTPSFEDGFRRLAEIVGLDSQELLGQFEVEQPPADVSTILTVSSAISERLIAHLATHPDELRTFDRRLFEELVAELFDGFGYEVELTKPTRDGGRDVIAIRHREVEVKYLIECKRPDPGHKVGVRPVRELFGVKTDEGATKAILATTAEFTKDALVFFSRHRWALEPRDHAGLLDWLGQYLRSRAS